VRIDDAPETNAPPQKWRIEYIDLEVNGLVK
jgi:hypothetical protein